MSRFSQGRSKTNLFGMRRSIGKSRPAVLKKRGAAKMLCNMLALFTSTVT